MTPLSQQIAQIQSDIDACGSGGERQLENFRAILDTLEAVRAHNEGCVELCGVGELEGLRCGYRPYFPRRCPDCPRYQMIGEGD